METAGLHKSYYPDVHVKPADEDAAKKVKEIADATAENNDKNAPSSSSSLPKAGDNPLDECRDFIAFFKNRMKGKNLRKVSKT